MNTEIIYSDSKEFCKEDLQDLFLSVAWSSGEYPEELRIAMQNSHAVYSAWHEGKLVGLINCLSDGIMTAYFHYMLVHPDYQGKQIGKVLMQKMLEKYENYARKVLVGYNEKVEFYQKMGFELATEASPMWITELKS